MRHKKKNLILASAAAFLVAVPLGLTANAWAQETDDDATGLSAGEPATWSVTGVEANDAEELAADGVDLVRVDDGTALIVADEAQADELRSDGWDVEFHDTVYKDVEPTTAQDDFYGGYRTSEAHINNLYEVESNYPELAQTFEIGESWLQTQGEGGHDIVAICLTEQQDGDCELSPDSDKPRISIVSQIHARELATGEISWRFIDHLTEGFGSDSDVTELLETTEVWIVPIANPDGVDVVASGGDQPILQRKNVNTSNGSCSGTGIGIDLNRNHSFKWGGASSDPCSETYQGPSAVSEPETQALEDLFTNIHPAQRGSDDDDPVPSDARDIMISLHSFGNYIIHPWAWTTDDAPNRTELRELGDMMSESNGYLVGTASETVGYLAPGGTDDFAYGELGVAGFTFEVGPQSGNCGGFLPAYSCMDDGLWPENRDALMTAALQAANPYDPQ